MNLRLLKSDFLCFVLFDRYSNFYFSLCKFATSTKDPLVGKIPTANPYIQSDTRVSGFTKKFDRIYESEKKKMKNRESTLIRALIIGLFWIWNICL